MILIVAGDSRVTATTRERALHGDRGIGVLSNLAIPIADVLKANFVDGVCSQHLRVAELDRIFVIENVITLGLERKQGNAAVGFFLPVEHVSNCERVLGLIGNPCEG